MTTERDGCEFTEDEMAEAPEVELDPEGDEGDD